MKNVDKFLKQNNWYEGIFWSLEDEIINRTNKFVLSSWTAASIWGFNEIFDMKYFITFPKGYNLKTDPKTIVKKQRSKEKYNLGIIQIPYKGKKIKVYSPERAVVEIIEETKGNYNDVIISIIKNFFTYIDFDRDELLTIAKKFNVLEVVKVFMAVYCG